MKDKEALELIKTNNPEYYDDFEKLGLELDFLGGGLFREVYKIRGTKLVVKIPDENCSCGEWEGAVEHSRQEMEAYNKIKKGRSLAYKVMKDFLPEVYYSNDKGIIVMKYYRTCRNVNVANVIEQVSITALGFGGDIHNENIGYEDGNWRKRFVILDLGFFEAI